MQVVHPSIEGLLVLTPRKFEDERGYFTESFNQKVFNEIVGADICFVQDNESVSSKNVLRGLHFQKTPHAQGKLVRVTSGSVLDIAVDLRKHSPTFGQWHGEILSAANGKMFWIPEGFAHGFIALEDQTRFLYKCTDYYAPDSEGTLLWNDPALNIEWGNNSPIVSEKDKKGSIFEELNSPF